MKYCPRCKTSYTLSQRFCTDDGAALTLPDPYNLLGRTIVEKYKLDALIGMGGMGAVYQSRHLSTDRIIALKILLPNLAVGNPRLLQLFEREAKIAGRLRHENIVDILDAGRSSDGIAYIAMEWLEGNTLEDELRRNSFMSYERISRILKQIVAALNESHSKYVIHRDLKPANIFLVKRTQDIDHVKVMDFGISKLISETKGSPVSVMMGTPQYASPEQFKLGENIDTRSDIYSLGIVLFQMLTASLPFHDSSISALIYKHLNEPPPPPSSIRSDVSPQLDKLINSMLAKEPSDRPSQVRNIPEIFDSSIADFVETSQIDALTSGNIQTSGITHAETKSWVFDPALPFKTEKIIKEDAAGQNIKGGQKNTAPIYNPVLQLKNRIIPIIHKVTISKSIIPIGIVIGILVLLIGYAGAHFINQYEWENAVESERKAFREGRFLDASNLIQDVLKRGESYGANDLHNALALHNAGELYLELARYDEAEKALQRTLEIREKLSEADTASTLYAMGNLHLTKKDKVKAEPFFRRSLQIREKLYGKEHPDVAESLIGLAKSLPEKQIEEAGEMAKRSINIFEKIFGKDHPDVAKGLSSLATVMHELGNPTDIESSLKRALQIREKFYGPNMHPDIASNLLQLGDYLLDRGRCVDADPYLRRSVTYFEAIYGKDHPATAKGYLSIADLSSKLNNSSAFKDYANRALTIIKKSSGADSKMTGMALLALGDARSDSKNYKDAETYLSDALTVLERSEKMSGENLAEAYAIFATNYLSQGALIKSEEYFQRAENLYEIALGKDHPLMSTFLLIRALIYLESNKLDKSEEILVDANSRIQNVSGNFRSMLDSLSLMVNVAILYKKEQFDEASNLMSRLMSQMKESPLLIGDLMLATNSIYITQNITQTFMYDFPQAGMKIINGTDATDDLNRLIQRMELSDVAAKRNLKIAESEQCSFNQNKLNNDKAIIGMLISMRALFYDLKGNHSQAMNDLRENRSFISAAFVDNTYKSKMNDWISTHSVMLRSKNRNIDANQIDSFYKSVRR